MQNRRFLSFPALDCIFLFAAVGLSAIPYVAKLGFYSDDWYNLAVLAHTSHSGVLAEVRGLFQADRTMMQRPVQAFYFAAAFQVFGLHAFPYHLLNISTIAIAASLLYLAALEISAERWVAFLIAICFGLAPHYCTDRFWFTMEHANLSACFAFLGTWIVSRAARSGASNQARDFAIAAVCFLLSFLSYEVMLGWIVASIGLVGVRSYRASHSGDRRRRSLIGIVLLAVPLLVVGLAKIFTQQYIARHHHFVANLGRHVRDAIAQGFQFNVWTFALKLPFDVGALFNQSVLTWSAAASAILMAVLVGGYVWRNLDASDLPRPLVCLRLAFLAIGIFLLGYVLFAAVPQDTFEFTSAGMDNRVAIAAAPGAACFLVALSALICMPLRSEGLRVGIFSVLIGLICLGNCLVVDGIAAYWADASNRQAKILRTLQSDAPSVPPGSVLLLDGFCRFSGPGFVFEADGDATGAVQIALRKPGLKGDVISPDLHFDRSSVNTTYYGAPEQSYEYGPQLFVYNVESRTLTPLTSQTDAVAYMRNIHRDGESGCPTGRDGRGVKIF